MRGNEQLVSDVIIVGSGPAGLFAAVELCSIHQNVRICLVDKGEDLEARTRRAEAGDRGPGWLEGFGGSGFFIGGRLSLDLDSPSGRPTSVGVDASRELRDSYLDLLKSWGAGGDMLSEAPEPLRRAADEAADVGLRWQLNYPALHLATDDRLMVLGHIQSLFRDRGVELVTSTAVVDVDVVDENWRLTVRTSEGVSRRYGRYLLLAPGRGGAAWLAGIAEKLGASPVSSASVGVRLAFDQALLAPLTDLTPDPRLFMDRPSGQFRTYAFAVGGRVLVDRTGAAPRITIQPGGATPSGRTSFSLLWQPSMGIVDLDRPSPEPATQSLRDVRGQSRDKGPIRSHSASAIPWGHVGDHWPTEYWHGLDDFLNRLDRLVPRIRDADVLVYSPAIERQWTYHLNRDSGTDVSRLYVAGDGSGSSQGAMASIISGMAVGRSIAAQV